MLLATEHAEGSNSESSRFVTKTLCPTSISHRINVSSIHRFYHHQDWRFPKFPAGCRTLPPILEVNQGGSSKSFPIGSFPIGSFPVSLPFQKTDYFLPTWLSKWSCLYGSTRGGRCTLDILGRGLRWESQMGRVGWVLDFAVWWPW